MAGPRQDKLSQIPEDVVVEYGLDRMPFDIVDARLTDLIDLRGKRIIVTGGGGPGLGQAIAHRLGGLGAAVAVLDVGEHAADAVAESVRRRWDVTAFSIRVDLTDPENVQVAIDEPVARLGGLDVLVNNAGGSLGLYGPFAEQDPVDVARIIALNLLGPMYASHAALKHMYAAGAGRIINISSESGKTGMPNLVAYASAKSGVIGFTRNLAHEVAAHGVSVVAVCPGMMLSPFGFERLRDLDDRASHAVLRDTLARASIRRAGLPEEVANMVAFLAGPAASYVHGTAVSVGGGISD